MFPATLRNRCRIVCLLWGLAQCLLEGPSVAGEEPNLTGTEPLTIDQPTDVLMVEGLQRFCRRELANSPIQRLESWKPHLANPAAMSSYSASRRDRFRSILGAVDPRRTADPAQSAAFELPTTLDQTSVIAKSERVTLHRVRWPVLDGVSAEGILLMPKTVRAAVIALPDADWTPEMFCGLHPGLPTSALFVRQLAESGCLVAIPTLISRSDEFSGHPRVVFTNQPQREFIYRQAFEVGRHVIGYEVQKVLAAVDLLQHRAPVPIGVIGIGEGGLLALYAAALDVRIQACWVSGYFQERESVWQEPIYRNVWGLLSDFGDAELAAMIAPRRLVIEACHAVEVSGPPVARPGRAKTAAPGSLTTCPLESVRAELARAQIYYQASGKPDGIVLAVSGLDGHGPPGTTEALTAFLKGLGSDLQLADDPMPWRVENGGEPGQDFQQFSDRRQRAQFDELQVHVQQLLLRSHHERDARWRVDPTAVETWKQRQPQLREWVHDELIGRFPYRRLPPRARSRCVLNTSRYLGYEVVMDVVDDVIAAGILLVPRDMQAGERRPVVVCQHGLDGTPMDTISREPGPFATYRAFSEELVHQGYVVYAPQNPYRGGEKYRVLQRMSNPLRRSLFTYIIAQHEQTLDWLATLPFVDPQRMAFYGLSYGGKTAMRVPPLVERYCLSICSGDFTDWPRTLAANNERFSYLFTVEHEVFEWNLAHVASYAELAMLMTPRPFMVEEGHRDGGQPSEWVAGEFGKVRRHYDQLGLGDRAVLEFFDGPHTIHGQGTYSFLRRELHR